ncbi:MAG: hypothetical protein ISP90_05680 [Nevskia sp.]|nr:hypothetical protein [Nevskia sp.]
MLVVLLGAAMRGGAMLNHDVGWLYIAAGRMLAGGTYTADFFEVNMPLAIAAYIPPQVLAAWFHWSANRAISVWTFALICQSVWLCLRVNPARWAAVAGGKPLVAAWLLIGLIFLPGYDFAQKEHLIAILGLPLLFLAAESGNGPGRGMRIHIALLAAFGFFLKPHYAPLPFLLLAANAVGKRSWKPLVSPEALTLVAAGLLDAIVTLALYRDWFVCLRWAGDLYGAFRSAGWSKVLRAPGMEIAAVCLAIQLGVALAHRDFRRGAWPLLLAAAYACIAYLAQFTGWSYHALPARIFVFAGQGLTVAACIAAGLRPALRHGLLALALAGAAAEAGAAVRGELGQPGLAALQRMPAAFGAAAPGDYVYAFSTEVVPVFPTVPLLNLKWASRFSHLWPLLRLATLQNPNDAAAARLRAAYDTPLVGAVAQDFERYRPTVVLVDRRDIAGAPPDFDILSPFLADPRFASIWRAYTKIGWVPYPEHHYGFDIYVRSRASAGPPNGAGR